ncbi:ExbD/TolR family protein [Ampullimonas aquatilis]|uniref:ExbD/TolR family protein n=1 Tax=Ampullimonas aquatilis TaxID=1341549 RepID=UPI003C720D5E
MAFNTNSSDDADMSDINMTPLVDVMLVLLIIFIITIPVMNHAVKIDLPQAATQPDEPKPQNINIAIDADGRVFWNEALLDDTGLQQALVQAAQLNPQPELHLRADRNVRYDSVAQVMSAANNAGLSKIGFVTDPQQKR